MDSQSPRVASARASEIVRAPQPATAVAPGLLGAIGNRGVARLAQGTQADRALLQRFALQQAVAVTGTQFHAQVKQASGSFRNAGGVVVAPGPPTTQLRVSEDGQMAVEDTNLGARQPKVFYATNAVFKASNKALKKHGSEFLLYVDQNNAITVTDQGGNQVHLHRILAKRKKVRNVVNDRGMGLTMKEVCDQVASEIVGHDVSLLLPNLEKALGMDATLAAHEYKVARWFADRYSHGEATAQTNVNVDVITNAAVRDQIAQDYMRVILNAPVAARLIAQELGINAFADPRVGQSYGSISMGNVGPGGIADLAQALHPRRAALTASAAPSGFTRDIWGTHYGAVVAESAGNKITLENYGRKGEDPTNVSADPIYYFQMYGPVTNAAQTWHGQWTTAANPIINPITMVYG